jgi:hypothetical protein
MVIAPRTCAVKSVVHVSGNRSSCTPEIVRVCVVVTLSAEFITAVEGCTQLSCKVLAVEKL